jgi:23S rRNA (adenine2503-C2)-methyltransferase
VPSKKFKIQFARMGEPSFNPAVLEVLRKLPFMFDAGALMPSLSTIAPRGSEDFMEELIHIKNQYYSGGHFQLQFSIHTTSDELRDRLIPIEKWDFNCIAEYGDAYWMEGDRKITLNFAPIRGWPIDARMLKKYFDPRIFIIKLTPLNPTHKVKEKGLESWIDPFDSSSWAGLIDALKNEGYDVILSIGELDENLIGSNCGQYITIYRNGEVIERPYACSMEIAS